MPESKKFDQFIHGDGPLVIMPRHVGASFYRTIINHFQTSDGYLAYCEYLLGRELSWSEKFYGLHCKNMEGKQNKYIIFNENISLEGILFKELDDALKDEGYTKKFYKLFTKVHVDDITESCYTKNSLIYKKKLKEVKETILSERGNMNGKRRSNELLRGRH